MWKVWFDEVVDDWIGYDLKWVILNFNEAKIKLLKSKGDSICIDCADASLVFISRLLSSNRKPPQHMLPGIFGHEIADFLSVPAI